MTQTRTNLLSISGLYGVMSLFILSCGNGIKPNARPVANKIHPQPINDDSTKATPTPSPGVSASPSPDPLDDDPTPRPDDSPLPLFAAVNLEFTDTDFSGGKVSGSGVIFKATDETTVDSYAVYWGSSATSQLAGLDALIRRPKNGSNLSFSLPASTIVPSGATHLIVYTVNSYGEMETGTGIALDDKGLPEDAAVSVSFTDTDPLGGRVSGTIEITRAFEEDALEDYVIYWGSAASQKLSGALAIGILNKSGTNLSLEIAAGTSLPSGATHILVRTKNADGEMLTGPSVKIEDLGLPTQAATSMAFVDTHPSAKKLDGSVSISKATDESSIEKYLLYWGSSATTKLNGVSVIAELPKTGAQLSYAFPAQTDLPAEATHLLVRTANEDGEMASGASVLIDDLGLPNSAANGISFEDTNQTGGKLGGTISINRAPDESGITDYVVYWGSNAATKLAGINEPFVTVAKNGENPTVEIPPNTSRPPLATHFLVRSKNSDGIMATGPNAEIIDLGAPIDAAVSIGFEDTNPIAKRLTGTVVVARAAQQAYITHYDLFWGSSISAVLANQPLIASKPKTNGNVSFALNSVQIPVGATHLIVKTRNDQGTMATGVGRLIDDFGVPQNAATSLALDDTDPTGREIAGTLFISKAVNESDLTHYVLYWGTAPNTKLAATNSIAPIAAKNENLTHSFANNTKIPLNATHLLVYSKNADGEMATGASLLIVDNGVPVHAPGPIALTDTNTLAAKLGGNVTVTKAAIEAGISHYVLYWGSSSSQKLTGTAELASVAVTGSNVSYALPAGTSIPAGATHLLARSKNSDGEMTTGPSLLIIDKGVPENAATSVTFEDSDIIGRKLSGPITVRKAPSETGVTHYVLYWGSGSQSKLAGSAEIASLAANGSDRVHQLGVGTPLPSGATHILVRTKNAGGEMATGVSVAIDDIGVPTHAAASVTFTDTDPLAKKIGGTVNIARAANESTLTHYVLFWASNATTKLETAASPIATIAKGPGTNLTVAITSNTGIPAGATHLLVKTKNSDGEMATGTSVPLDDLGLPSQAAAAVTFIDTDSTSGEISGDLNITKATSESTLTHYVVYWGFNSTTKLPNMQPIASLAKVPGANLKFNIATNTRIPQGATHILVRTKNNDGEMLTGPSVLLSDKSN